MSSGIAAESVSIAGDGPDHIRELLARHRRALETCEALAMALLDSVRPDAPPLTGDLAHERRQAAADAVAMVQSGRSYLEEVWRMPGLERRKGAPDAPLPASVSADRRRKRAGASPSPPAARGGARRQVRE